MKRLILPARSEQQQGSSVFKETESLMPPDSGLPDHDAVVKYNINTKNQLVLINPQMQKAYIPVGMAFFISGTSPLANRFPEVCGIEQKDSLDLYRGWLRRKIETGDRRVNEAIQQIEHALKLTDVALQCYCMDARCHGHIIIDEILRSR